MRLQNYLSKNKAALDTTVSSLTELLATKDDSDRDRRVIARNAYKALKGAIQIMLGEGLSESRCWGASGDIAVMIYRPEPGRDLFGRFVIRAGRLGVDSQIPCPDDWPSSGATLPPFLETLIIAASQPKKSLRVVTVDAEGTATLGLDQSGKQYLVEVLPGDEMWWRPLEDPEEA